MTYDKTLFDAAHTRFLVEPKSLTDDDLTQLAVIDPRLAERARAKRAGFVEADDDWRTLAKKTVSFKGLVEFFRDHVAPVLAVHRHKSEEATTRLDFLEARVLDLEVRLAAARHEPVERDAVPR
jgi:hypothetical protein